MSLGRMTAFTFAILLLAALAGCSRISIFAPIHKTSPPESPVIVKGGSIDFLARKGWNWSSTNTPCSMPGTIIPDMNPCYVSSPSTNPAHLDTSKITIVGVTGPGVTNDSIQLAAGQPWKITVFESKADGSLDTNGVFMCSSDANGNCNQAGYVTIQATSGDGFYNVNPTDMKYHHYNCKPSLQDQCEGMKAVSFNGAATYTCKASNGCFVYIGSY